MTTSTETWTEEFVEAAGVRLHLMRGGTGEPLLILHDELGYPVGCASMSPWHGTIHSISRPTLVLGRQSPWSGSRTCGIWQAGILTRWMS